jgi:plasmid maintenance system antidote protein VapI
MVTSSERGSGITSVTRHKFSALAAPVKLRRTVLIDRVDGTRSAGVESGSRSAARTTMPTSPQAVPLADALREAIRASGLSYSRLAQLAKLDSGTISHFMVGERDMTLGVASRLCAVLGYGLTKVGEAVTEPLADPPKTNRDPKGRKPASVVKRGRGRRVDLEEREADSGVVANTKTDKKRNKRV